MSLFSIVVPVYNVEKYLADCLDSLLGQTLDDMEIVCVNDGSTDSSGAILEQYAARDPRIIAISQENAGLSAARNAGVRRSTGKYVCFVDSDDMLIRDACAVLKKQIGITQPDIIVFGLKDLVRAPVDEWFREVSTTRNAWYSPFDPYALLYEKGGYPYACRNCFRRAFLTEHNIEFDENVRYGEDIIYQFLSFPFAHRIQFIPDKLYLYRRLRAGSLTRVMNESLYKRLKQHIGMMAEIYEGWQARGFMDKYGYFLHCWMLNFIVPDFGKIPAEQRREPAADMLRAMPRLEEYTGFMNGYDASLAEKLKRYARGGTNDDGDAPEGE